MRLLLLLLLLIFVRDMGHTEGEACKRAPQEYKHTHHTHKIVIHIQQTYSEQR